MAKEGKKTVAGTSMDEVYIRILDAFINKTQKTSVLNKKKKSRSEIMQDAILIVAYLKGDLEEFLKAEGAKDQEVQQTIQRLKAEYNISSKP